MAHQLAPMPRHSRPRFQPRHPFARGCIFASLPGWPRGSTASGRFGAFDDTKGRGMRGFWTLNNGPQQYQNWQAGPGVDNGDGVTSDSSFQWDITPISTKYDISAFGMTAAVAIRPDVLATSTTIPFFKRRAQPYGATQPGWCFTAAASNKYQVRICDGTTEAAVTSTTTMSTTRIDLVAFKYDGGTLRLFVNGVQEAATSATFQVGNPATEDIKVLGLGPANETFSGFVDFAAVWNRPFSGQDMRTMVDRFAMWRERSQLRGALSAFQTFLLSF